MELKQKHATVSLTHTHAVSVCVRSASLGIERCVWTATGRESVRPATRNSTVSSVGAAHETQRLCLEDLRSESVLSQL